MSEGGNVNERFLWDDDQLWDFQIPGNTELISNQHLDRRMMDIININSPDDEVVKDVQVPTPMPPPPPKPPAAAAGKKRKSTGGADKGKGKKVVGESDHEMHILTERERRKKMRDMFACLHALLPQLPAKADKSTIVDEAVSYIGSLQETLEKLQQKKFDRLRGVTNSTGSIFAQKLATESREAFLAEQGANTSSSVAIPPVPKFPTTPNFQTYTSPNVVLNTFGEDAHISICAAKKPGLFTAICYVLEKYRLQVVSAQVSSNQCRSTYLIHTHANGASEHFPVTFTVEELYKQAATEIMGWVNA